VSKTPRVLDSGQVDTTKGIFAWFARNPVAANILIILVMVGGLRQLYTIKQEVFPQVDLDLIVIQIGYLGASPAEVEKGVTLVTEEAIRGIEGVKKVTSTSGEGFAAITVELQLGTDTTEALNKVRAAVDRITTYPESIEKPIIFEATNRFQVISLVVYGDQDEATLKAWGERAREDLLAKDGITMVEVTGTRAPEISIEIPQETLRRYRLTLDVVAAIVRASSVEVPAGRIKTKGGEILLRTDERRDSKEELAEIVVLAQPDGTEVRLGEIATITDGFADTDQTAYFNGKRAVMVDVYRVGDEKPLDVAKIARDYVEEFRGQLPPGVELAVWFDTSEFYEGRMDLLLDNALQGLVLVIIVIGLFLEIRLAFWVTLGIPVSFLGSLMFLPAADVSINMLSLFAFILALGSVVDDAINIGESVHRYRSEGKSRAEAAILGVKEVAVPVTFAIAVICIAYAPMLFVPGVSGKFFRQIPVVVIGVLFISLMESLFILPAHLAHSKENKNKVLKKIDHYQSKIARGLEWVIARTYVPLVAAATRRRYLTLAVAFSLLLSTCGLVGGGHVRFTFMPEIESDAITFEAKLPFGTSVEETRKLEDALVRTAREVMAEQGGEANLSRGVWSMVGMSFQNRGPGGGEFAMGGHIALAWVYLVPIDQRSIHADEFARLWREKMKDYPGIDSIDLAYTTGFSAGKAIDIELSHPDPDTLEKIASQLAHSLRDFEGVKDIDDGYTDAKLQLDLKLSPNARAAGLSSFDLARTVRGAFFGAEALRFQRGRDEVRVFVRLPEEERVTEHSFEELIVQTPTGAEMPISAAAEVERSESYTEIVRIDGRRAVAVTADVDQVEGNANEVVASLVKDTLPALQKEYPQMSWRMGGEQREQEESMRSLLIGMLIAVAVMYALLSIVFKSYVQPLAVLFAIPFGIVGAVVGHIVMGYTLSLMSMMGIVALSGVAINDSLVYVDAINRRREAGASAWRAAVEAGAIRCRPIVLTAITAFIGLFPMITETSLQARFLIPMAVSLGFGIMFSTLVTLLVVPCFYLLIEDIRRGCRWLWYGPRGGGATPALRAEPPPPAVKEIPPGDW
jgi:multidrug efflux pump subunit AcrB